MTATLENIKLLRTATDAPYGDCVKALQESDNDLGKAKEALLSMGRGFERVAEAREGYITGARDETNLIVFVARCETDFVGRNEEFRRLADLAAQGVLLGKQDSEASFVDAAQMKFKEKIETTVFSYPLPAATYVHHDGKKAAVILLESGDEDAARKIAIQVVATRPTYMSRSEVDAAYLQSEIDREKTAALATGKPEMVAEKIAQGKLNSKMKEDVLLEQAMYDDAKQTVEAYASANKIALKGFELMVVGQR